MLVAREPAGSTTTESTSALIDFFRNTPPPRNNDINTVRPNRNAGIESSSNSSSLDAFNAERTQSYSSSYASQTELIKKGEHARSAEPSRSNSAPHTGSSNGP